MIDLLNIFFRGLSQIGSMARASMSALALAAPPAGPAAARQDFHFGVDVKWDAAEEAAVWGWAERFATETCNARCALNAKFTSQHHSGVHDLHTFEPLKT